MGSGMAVIIEKSSMTLRKEPHGPDKTCHRQQGGLYAHIVRGPQIQDTRGANLLYVHNLILFLRR